MRDSYLEFFAQFGISKKQFFEFGLEKTICVDHVSASNAWEDLKRKIKSNEPVFIRGFGREAKETQLYLNLYYTALGNNNIQKDATNNAEPTRLIEQWTGFSKSQNKKFNLIRNYQISHVFGRTKNPFCFTAPWNIVYLPKIIDPFTGHEAKGDLVDEFSKIFQQEIYNKFKQMIENFNEIMCSTDFKDRINNSLENMYVQEDFTEKRANKLKASIEKELSPIEII